MITKTIGLYTVIIHGLLWYRHAVEEVGGKGKGTLDGHWCVGVQEGPDRPNLSIMPRMGLAQII
jgi:hypothetical protein